jgi:ankyrin repeat protein
MSRPIQYLLATPPRPAPRHYPHTHPPLATSRLIRLVYQRSANRRCIAPFRHSHATLPLSPTPPTRPHPLIDQSATAAAQAGYTPLHIAASSKQPAAAMRLIQKGADAKARTKVRASNRRFTHVAPPIIPCPPPAHAP